MKKFDVMCDFNGAKSLFTLYIGFPKPDAHPLQHQSTWLSKERGGSIPSDIMDGVAKLRDISIKNNVSFEELCVYALGVASETSDENSKSGLDFEQDDEDDTSDLFDDELNNEATEGTEEDYKDLM